MIVGFWGPELSCLGHPYKGGHPSRLLTLRVSWEGHTLSPQGSGAELASLWPQEVNRYKGKNYPIMNLHERTLSVLACRVSGARSQPRDGDIPTTSPHQEPP